MLDSEGGRGDARTLVEHVLGLAEIDAMREVLTAGCRFRVASRDGVEPALSMDHRADRLNVTVRDGVIVDARVG